MNASNVHPEPSCGSAIVISVDPTGHVDAMVDPARRCRDRGVWGGCLVWGCGLHGVEVEEVLAIKNCSCRVDFED